MEIKMIELATDYTGCADRIGHRLHGFSQMEINGNKNHRTGHRLHGLQRWK
jgi:hypothetical protein